MYAPTRKYRKVMAAAAQQAYTFYRQPSERIGAATYRSTGMSAVNAKKRGRRYGSGRSLKDKIRQLEPAKHFQTTDTTLGQTLTHNVAYVHSPTMNILKGTSDNQRVGDTIYLEAIKFKLLAYDSPSINQPVFYQVVFGYIDVDTLTNVGWQGATTSDFTYSNGLTYGVMDIVDPKKITTIAEYTIKLPHVVEGSSTAELLEDTIQLKTRFVYETANQFGKYKNLVCYIKGIMIGGTPSLLIGDVLLTYDLIYKDSN